jgi:hypothetical protein
MSAVDKLIALLEGSNTAEKTTPRTQAKVAGVSLGDSSKLSPDDSDMGDQHLENIQRIRKRWKDDPNLHQNEDISKSDTLTGKTFDETLKASRLADKLNNQWYRTPISPGYYFGGAARASGGGHYFQMPVETEEMRTMQRARAAKAGQMEAEQGRQQAFRNIPLEAAQAERSFSSKWSELKRDQQMEWARETYTQELMLRVGAAKANMIMGVFWSDPALAILLGQVLGSTIVPAPMQVTWLSQQAELAQEMRDAGKSQAEITVAINQAAGELLTESTGAGIKGAVQGVKNTVRGN